jgi:Mrp family chromosome partitioning ATPase/uncharacterized protein involved in exopolysaccharide biosynthesis
MSSPSVLQVVLQRRWWVLILIATVSAATANWLAGRYSKQSALSQAAVIHTGLPGVPGPDVYEPLGPKTCSELLTSINVLNEVLAKRGLNMPPTVLADLLTVTQSRTSNLINVQLAWGNPKDAVAVLNDLLNVFVEHIASQRRATLREHMAHVETALLQARIEVDDARQRIKEYQLQQEKLMEEGGLTGDQYRSVLTNISNTQLTIDDKKVQQLGIEEQIAALGARRDAATQLHTELVESVKQELTQEIRGMFERLRSRYSDESTSHRFFSGLLTRIDAFSESPDAPAELERWQSELVAAITDDDRQLSAAETQELSAILETVGGRANVKLRELDLERRDLRAKQDQLMLSQIPVKNQIEMLQQRLVAYQAQADELSAQITGIHGDRANDYEVRLAEAENQEQALAMQLDNMRQLEKCRVREWTVSMKASDETTEVYSNGKKIFAASFFLLCLTLSSPLFLAEWYARRESPQVLFARALRLPMLAENVLQYLLPSRSGPLDLQRLGDHQLESLRMLALRIQQSAHRAGSVILMSSLDASASAAPLMTAVAQCLAQREERLLLIDAVSSERSPYPLASLLPTRQAQPDAPEIEEPAMVDSQGDRQPPHPRESDSTALVPSPGLAEYLADSQRFEVNDLIRHSGCDGIDVIASGSVPFSREAMASSALTGLLEQCSRNYTLVLVNGPAARWSADLEMLTARADGVVLMATPRVKNDASARAVVNDLIELEAPLVGVVS